MHSIGVDLAWGERAWTGLAVLDREGTLLDLTRARSDSEILAWLRPWTAGPCMVAIDAPIIVKNATGQRRCEGLIGRYFGSRGVFAHSSNAANPAFSSGTRAQRIAGALGLDTAAESTAERRAVEVYPHPALVALFDLPQLIPYKNRPGRDLAQLKAETSRLLGYLEFLHARSVPLHLASSPRWSTVTSLVANATTKAELAAVEDEIDAVICAYVAALADREPDSLRYIGDTETGYILTPVTPEIAARIDADRPGYNVPTSSAGSVEDRAVQWAMAHERDQGREPRDTRRTPGAAADIVSPPRTIEVKAYGGTARGSTIWLEPRQMHEAKTNSNFHLYVVDNVNDPSRTRLHDLHGPRLEALVRAARERHYYELPWPVADYDDRPGPTTI